MKLYTKILLWFSICALLIMGMCSWGFIRYVERALWQTSIAAYFETVHSIGQSLGTSFTRDLGELEELADAFAASGRDLNALKEENYSFLVLHIYTEEGCLSCRKTDAELLRQLCESTGDFGIMPPHISSVNGSRVFNIWIQRKMASGRRFWLCREYDVQAFTRQMIGAFGSLQGGVYVTDTAGKIFIGPPRGRHPTRQFLSEFISQALPGRYAGEPEQDGGTRASIVHVQDGGVPSIMFTVPLFQKNQWNLVGIVPESAFQAGVSDFLSRAFLLILVCCLGVGLFMGLFFHLKAKSQRTEHALMLEKLSAYSASAAKSRFLSNMTHDMRTPLNAITGMTIIALRALGDDRKVEASLRKIDHACKLLLGIVNDILDMSRIESGKMTLVPEPTNLPEMMRELEEMMEANPVAAGKHISLHVENVTSPVVHADPARLRQIVLNIFSNAVKYTPEGGSIVLELRQLEGEASLYRFRCTDTGMGMDDDLKARLFQPFERATDSSVNKMSGTGLGLSITKNLVELMGGSISVDSTLGRGTDIAIDIPLEPAEVQAEAPSESPSGPESLDGVHVLVAEDNDLNAEVARELLSFLGVTMDRAANGEEAVRKLLDCAPDTYAMVFMDVHMPVMDGIEATRRIRQLERADLRHIPIVALTANAFSEERDIVLQAGMNDCMTKPVEMARLFAMVRQWAGKDSAGR